MIEIYPSKLPGEPLERHAVDGETFGDWLARKVPSYRHEQHAALWSVEFNGRIVPQEEWLALWLTSADTLRVRFEAKGGAFDAIGSIVSSVFSFVGKLFGLSTPSVPDYNSSQTQGSEVSGANVEANTAKRNDVIVEMAGRRRIYPSYCLPPHKYFVEEDGKTVQYIELMLSVAKGRYQILAEEVLIGSTPLLALGNAATFQVYEPGADLSADSAHRHWYIAPEVGSTSTGSAGLELRATTTVDRAADVSAVTFAGSVITATNAAQEGDDWTDAFPEGWTAGQVLRVEQPQSVVFSGGDTVQMDFSRLEPAVGLAIEIVGTNAGEYLIATHTPATDATGTEPGTEEQVTLSTLEGAPVTWLKSGSFDVAVGVKGLRYRIVSADRTTLSVEKLQENGSVAEDWPGFFGGTYAGADVPIGLDEYSLEGDWAGTYAACPPNKTTTQLEFDVFFQGGLCRINDKGNLRDQSVTVEFQYRDMAVGGEWTSIQRSWTRKTRDQLGFTIAVDLPSAMRPECRMRRIGAESTDTQVSDAVEWYGLRCELETVTRYDVVTTLSVKVRGGDRLAAQSENKVSVIGTRLLPVRREGAWQPEQPTRDIVPWVMHAAKSVGYTDAQLDLEELDRLDAICRARGDKFDHLVEDGTVRETIRDALSAGFAELTLDLGKILPVRDEPRTQLGHSYTLGNMAKPLQIRFDARKPDDYDGIDVEYTSALTWKTETIECRLPDDKGLKVKKVSMPFVTNPTQAWRIGMRERCKLEYRRWGFTWGTEMDALNSRFGSYVPVTSDVPGYGQSAVLEAIEVYDDGRDLLTLSEPPQWESGANHVVAVTKPTGRLDGPHPAEPGPTQYQVICPALSFQPDFSGQMEAPRVHFGTAEQWCFDVLINKITPGSDDQVSVEAENYDARVYQYDDAQPPA